MENRYRSYNSYKHYKGYKSLPFFQQTEIIYDFTVAFCRKFINSRSRTYDQMVQAARSGKQNIAEGYLQKSLTGRIKLLGVSRGSLEELLNDYYDYLRQNSRTVWRPDSLEAKEVRKLVYKSYKDYKDYKIYIERSPELATNTIICFIHQTNRLIDHKLRWMEEQFIKERGFRENLFKKRQALLKNKDEKTTIL